MYNFKGLSTILFAILLFINSSLALYKDQAGVLDWHQAFVGTPKISYFQKIIGRSNLIVGTKHNVIANLNLRSSVINWRHALKPNEQLIALAPLDNYIVSLSESKGSNIRIWNGQNGYLINEFVVEDTKKENIENGDIFVYRSYIFALIRGGTVIKINNVTKSQEGKFKLSDNNYSKIFFNDKTNEIVVIGKNNKGQLIVTVLESNGKTISDNATSNIKFEVEDVFYTGEALVIKDFNQRLYTLDPKKSSPKLLSFENVKEIVHVQKDKFVVKTEDNSNILVKISNSIEKLATFENNEEGIISIFTNDEDCYISKTVVSNKKSLVVEIMNANTAKMVKVFEIKNDYANFGYPVKVSLDSYRKKDGTILYRIFTVTEDGSIHLYKEESLVWDREESLANVVDLKFIGLPELTKSIPEAIINSANSGFLSQITTRIQYQISSIVEELFKKKIVDNSGKDDILKRDDYGFKQLLLFLTKEGKLICMETLSKKTIWTRFLGKEIEGFEGIKLTNIRSSAVQYPPIVAVIASQKVDNQESTLVYSIDATTGKDYTYANKNISSMVKYPFKLLQTFRLDQDEKQDKVRIIALIKSETEVEFYPNTSDVMKSIAEMKAPIYFNLNDKIGGNTLKGYKLYINDNKKPQIDFLYRKTFPENETIVAYGFKEPYDRVASLGKVLGNRNVLYKYLNPNVLAVATIKPDEKYTSVLSLYFIDTVKGSVIHHSYYEGGGETAIMKPQIIQYENIVICVFWNHGAPFVIEEVQDKETKKLQKNIKKGSQIVVFELYESEVENEKDTNQEFSSFNYIQPYIASKSYLFDSVITSIGVTSTRNSIANREIIVGLDSNEMYGIHSILLNARRKISPPTNNDKQEGLIQYRPGIPINTKFIMTYSLPVTGITTIISNPATLESTSLVAAYGLDIFITRRSPSHNFDVLSEAFNKPILVVTMVAVLVAVIYTSKKIKSNEFRQAWKVKSEKKDDKNKKNE